MGRRAKSQTNDLWKIKCKKRDITSSKMHLKGIIWGRVGEKFEIYASEKI